MTAGYHLLSLRFLPKIYLGSAAKKVVGPFTMGRPLTYAEPFAKSRR